MNLTLPTMKVKKLFADAKLPVRGGQFESGADVFVYRFEKLFSIPGAINNDDLQEEESITLDSMDRVLINTGISATVQEGFEIQVRPRSGNALNRGLSIVNTPGTIDASYRGPIGVIIINLSNNRQQIKVGEKIAQLVVCPVVYSEIVEVTDLDETERNDKGFGSSGNF